MLIYLVGFMGSGKTYYGQKWAAEMGIAFYDLDALIEKQEQLTISEIFLQKGEAYFRKIEAAILLATTNLKNAIVACGGGTACFYKGLHVMKVHGKVIFLNISVPTILKNIENQIQQRPMLQHLSIAELNAFVQQKLAERLPIYLQSDMVLDEAILFADHFSITTFI